MGMSWGVRHFQGALGIARARADILTALRRAGGALSEGEIVLAAQDVSGSPEDAVRAALAELLRDQEAVRSSGQIEIGPRAPAVIGSAD